MPFVQVSKWDGSNLEVSAYPAGLAFGITELSEDYIRGDEITLTVLGLDVGEAFEIRYSPSGADPFAAGSVSLSIPSFQDFTTYAEVAAICARGAIRYLDTGHLWLVQGANVHAIPVQLQIDSDKIVRVLSSAFIPGWQAGVVVAVDDEVVNPLAGSVGIRYKANTAGTTGSSAPVHTSGTASDGGVSWTFVEEYGRFYAQPDFSIGDMLIAWNVQPAGDINIDADGGFDVSAEAQSCRTEAHITGVGYTNEAVQFFEDPPEEGVTRNGTLNGTLPMIQGSFTGTHEPDFVPTGKIYIGVSG